MGHARSRARAITSFTKEITTPCPRIGSSAASTASTTTPAPKQRTGSGLTSTNSVTAGQPATSSAASAKLAGSSADAVPPRRPGSRSSIVASVDHVSS